MRLKPSQINAAVIIMIAAMVIAVTFIIGNQSASPVITEDFYYKDDQSKAGHLYQFSKQPVILHFWASWCLPCREELPQLIKRAKSTPDTVFLLLSVDHTSEEMTRFIQPFLSGRPSNLILIHDKDAAITMGHFKIDLFPETIILNPDKTLQQHLIGPANWEKIGWENSHG